MTLAYTEGQDAYKKKWGYDALPYKRKTFAALDWIAGWLQAQTDEEEARAQKPGSMTKPNKLKARKR